MKKKYILPFLASLAALFFLHDGGYCAANAEELARKFVRGLQSRAAFEEMNEIFFQERDFDLFVLMVRKLQGLSPETLERVRNSDEVEKARRSFVRDREGFKKIWEGAVKKSVSEKSTAEYTGHTVKSSSPEGLTVYEIEITFTVARENKKEQGSAKVTAIMLEGAMKIADLVQLKI